MRLFLLTAILFSTTLLWGQEVVVKDLHTLEVIDSAEVSDGKVTLLTDKDGKVDLTKLSSTDTLSLLKLGVYDFLFMKSDLIEGELWVVSNDVWLDEFKISSSRWRQPERETAISILKYDRDDLNKYQPQTTADALAVNGEVFVQKSQLGGGSPMLRGFAANSILLVVDGVRMNNAIFRGGNLQNIINLDVQGVGSVEVLPGPSSVMYGSDALGGTIHVQTREVNYNTSDTLLFSGELLTRYSSASNESTLGFLMKYKNKNWAGLTSVSYSGYDDLKSGDRRSEGYDGFGYRDSLVIRSYGRDSIIANPDPSIQRFSGFQQVNFLQKLKFKLSKTEDLTLIYNLSQSSIIPRYDRLTQQSGGSLKFAEWFYGPQIWQKIQMNLESKSKKRLYDKSRFSMAYQRFEESRIDRRFREDWRRVRVEKVDVVSLYLDFYKRNRTHKWFYGVESQFNAVNSEGEQINLVTLEQESVATRYPDLGSETSSHAAYIKLLRQLGGNYNLSAGMRGSVQSLSARFGEQSIVALDQESFTTTSSALTSSLEGIYYKSILKADRRVSHRFVTGISSGFRAPNVDDLAKIFDSGDGKVLVPNEQLRPEYTYNAEVSFQREVKDTLGKKFLEYNVTGFYTYLDNAVVKRDDQVNGMDSVVYDGVLSQVQTLQNTGYANICGVNFKIEYPIIRGAGKDLFLGARGQYIYGVDNDGVRLRHVPPVFGYHYLKLGTSWGVWRLEHRYSGGIDFEDLAMSEKDKAYLYPEAGAVGWQVINLRYNRKFMAEKLIIFAGVDNVLNVHYRAYSSGLSGSGRNVYASILYKF